MGSYCELYIGDYPVLPSKSYASPVAMTMFRETDKRIFSRRVAERNTLVWGPMDDANEKVGTVVEYRASVACVKDRLDVMGFNWRRVKEDFERERKAELERLEEWSDGDTHGLWERDIALLKSSGLDDFLDVYKFMLMSRVPPYRFREEVKDRPPLSDYVLNHDELLWGFPCTDIRYCIRALIEISNSRTDVVQDLTEVVHAGYYDESDSVSELALEELKGDYPVNSRIIILTEGTSDTEVLRPSLGLLYPHLADYYRFMDFGVRPPGGVGPLATTVKSFAAAGIENRIVALFDNDTAAYAAVATLDQTILPRNIRVLHLPPIVLAEEYPTYGPSGLVSLDVNGLAGSIELYLGRDVLTTENGLTPVQWKGIDERRKQYQGELVDKHEIRQRFMAKLNRCQTSPEELANGDWAELRAVFEHVFKAFQA